ncbi:MAG TPA: ATP-binding protein [Jatrophihabitans sp.]
MTTQMRGELLSVATARNWSTAQLRSLYADAQGLYEDVALVVSELASNSVQAHAPQFGLSLEAHHDIVRVEVTDDAAGWPTLGKPDLDDVHGRGLILVCALASNWGARSNPESKTVWAELVVTEATRPSFECERTRPRAGFDPSTRR